MTGRYDIELFNQFEQAMELDPDNREAYLVSLNEKNPGREQDIRSLVEQYDQSRSFFEEPLVPRFREILGSA